MNRSDLDRLRQNEETFASANDEIGTAAEEVRVDPGAVPLRTLGRQLAPS